MSFRQWIGAAAGALTLVASATLAHAAANVRCETFSPAKNAPPVTHCVPWTDEMAALLKAAGCDPQHMTPAAMRSACADLMAHADASVSGGAA